MTRIHSIPLSWARRHCANAVAEGVCLDYLFEQALISPRFGDDRDRISSAQLALLYYHANISTEDEARRNSRAAIPIGFGTLAVRTLFGCSTLEAAIGAVIHLYEMASSAMKVRLRVEHEEASLIVHCEGGRTGADTMSLEDSYLSFLFMCINHFLGRRLPLIDMVTRDPAHMNLGSAHWATGAVVRLGGVSAMRFPRAMLASPRVSSGQDNMFWDIFRPWLDFVEGRAIADFGPDFSRDAWRVDVQAEAAGVSAATYRRRMDQSEGGFRQTRAAAIVAASLPMLLNTRDSIDSVAVRLGYSDARSFRRFIKASTGKTPLEWRGDEIGGDIVRPDPAVRIRVEAFARQMDVQLNSSPF